MNAVIELEQYRNFMEFWWHHPHWESKHKHTIRFCFATVVMLGLWKDVQSHRCINIAAHDFAVMCNSRSHMNFFVSSSLFHHLFTLTDLCQHLILTLSTNDIQRENDDYCCENYRLMTKWSQKETIAQNKLSSRFSWDFTEKFPHFWEIEIWGQSYWNHKIFNDAKIRCEIRFMKSIKYATQYKWIRIYLHFILLLDDDEITMKSIFFSNLIYLNPNTKHYSPSKNSRSDLIFYKNCNLRSIVILYTLLIAERLLWLLIYLNWRNKLYSRAVCARLCWHIHATHSTIYFGIFFQ